MRSAVLFLVLSASPPAAPAVASPPPPPPAAPRSVLFVGNSLTAAHDLAGRVRDLARAAGYEVRVRAVARPGFSLEDHLAAGSAMREVRRGTWDVVVLQQGPSTLPASRAALVRDAGRFAEEIRRAGAEPVLLMAWPLPGQPTSDVAASYRAAAAATRARLIPAGEALAAAATADPSLRLFQSDGFHPSRPGTDVVALSVLCALFGGATPPGEAARLSPAVVRAACPP